MQLISTSNNIRLMSNFVNKINVKIVFNPIVDFVIWYVVKNYQMCRILSLIQWLPIDIFNILSIHWWHGTLPLTLESNNLPLSVSSHLIYIYLIQYQDLIPISNFPASRIRTLIQLVGEFGGASIPTTDQCSRTRREWHIIPKILKNWVCGSSLFYIQYFTHSYATWNLTTHTWNQTIYVYLFYTLGNFFCFAPLTHNTYTISHTERGPITGPECNLRELEVRL